MKIENYESKDSVGAHTSLPKKSAPAVGEAALLTVKGHKIAMRVTFTQDKKRHSKDDPEMVSVFCFILRGSGDNRLLVAAKGSIGTLEIGTPAAKKAVEQRIIELRREGVKGYKAAPEVTPEQKKAKKAATKAKHAPVAK